MTRIWGDEWRVERRGVADHIYRLMYQLTRITRDRGALARAPCTHLQRPELASLARWLLHSSSRVHQPCSSSLIAIRPDPRRCDSLHLSANRSHDRLDALAIAVAHFTAQMALEHAKEEQKDKERRLQEELQRFMEATLGLRPKEASGAIKRYS